MSKAVTKPSGNIHFGFGVKTSRSFGPAPLNKGIRSTVKPHALAMKATPTRSAVPIYPRPAVGVATAGNPR